MKFFITSLLLGLHLLACPARAQDPALEFIAKTRASRLWEDRYWHLLLHYKPSFIGVKSEVVNREFFLSPKGRTNPQGRWKPWSNLYFKKTLLI